jgi:hypothetical protein
VVSYGRNGGANPPSPHNDWQFASGKVLRMFPFWAKKDRKMYRLETMAWEFGSRRSWREEDQST